MKVYGKILKSVLLFMTIILLLCGCSAQKEQIPDEEVPTVNIGITARTGLSKDLYTVNQKLGDLTEKKAGVRAQLVWTGLNSSYGNSYYKNRQMGVDILNIYYNQFEEYCEKSLLLDLEPYLGKDSCLREILKEKTERPDVVPWALEKRTNAVIERSPIADVLDGCLSGILYEGTDDAVCNVYESDAYTKRVELAKRWQEKGYLADNILTNIEPGQTQVISGEAFAAEFVVKPDEMQYEESIYGDKVIIIPFDRPPVLDTEDDWITVWSIFSETKYPEEAVKVLELLYNDEEVLNMILYGVEGLHYEVEEDGSFSFPDGVTENNVGYTCSVKWQFNTPKAGIWSGMSEDLEKDFKEFEASAEVSPAYGFWLDESKITVDMQKIKAIVSGYKKFLNVGMTERGLSTEAYLEEFRQKLREAGSEQLVKEVSKQYQAWKKEKEGQKAGK